MFFQRRQLSRASTRAICVYSIQHGVKDILELCRYADQMNDYMVQKFDEHANRVQEEIERCQHLRQLQIEHTGGLFESTSSTGGLFGNRPSSGGLFGPASSTGGLFGNNSSRAMVRNTGGGLFGTTPSTGGLFGDHSSGAMVSNTGGGLFRHSSSFLNDALSQPRVSNAAYERREVTFSANGNATYSQELFRDPPSHFGGGLFGNNGGS